MSIALLKDPIYLKVTKGKSVFYVMDSVKTIQNRLGIHTTDEDLIPVCLKDRWKFDSVERITKEDFHLETKKVCDSMMSVRYF